MEHRQVGDSDDSIPVESIPDELGSQACVGVGQCRHQTGEMCQAGVSHKQICRHYTEVGQVID